MELNFKIKTDEGTKDNSKKPFSIWCLIIIIAICFSIYCFTSNGYNFGIYIEGQNKRAVITGTYNNSIQE